MRNTLLLLTLLTASAAFGQKAKPAEKVQKNPFVQTQKAPTQRNCHTVEMENKLQQKYPKRLDEQTFEMELQRQLDQFKAARVNSEELYQITTIVHVIHSGQAVGTEPNITAAQVNSQFAVLNEDFRKMAGTPGGNTHPDGADIFIEFVPATTDPNGNPLTEPGINRVNGGQDSWGESDVENNLKPNTIWDPERYFNIWVVNFGGDLDGVLGYAQFPSMSGLGGFEEDEGPANTDGVIIGHQYFGTTGTAEFPFDGGRTTTHEVGHWLGLRHIWGDGGCAVDDYCDDTPRAGEENYGCPTGADSCPNDDLLDMIENYMDYTDDACMNIFTNDQKARIRTVMAVSPRRKNLALPPCSEATSASIGTNQATPPQWFTYTATSAEVVTISSVGAQENTYLSVYGTCNSAPIVEVDDAYGTLQSEFSIALDAAESIKVFWSGRYSQETFNWTLSTSAQVSGAACSLAPSAIEGENVLPTTTLGTYWYTYTQPDVDARITINAVGRRYAVYSNTCDQLKLETQGSGQVDLLNIAQGESIFIALEADGGDFSWTLSVTDIQAGEACVTAVAAQEGTNNTPTTPYWFKYTMTEELGAVTISSTGQTAVATSAKVYDGCGGNLVSNNVAVGSQTTIRLLLEQDDEIYIHWENVGAGSFDWTLTKEIFTGGDECENPKDAVIGTNTADDLGLELFWTRFTMPESGKKLVISSTSDEYVYITTSDCDNLDLLFFGESNATAIGLEAGEEILIVWEMTNGVGFNWNLAIEDLVPGDDCLTALVAVEGTNSAPYAPRWYTFTMPHDGALRIQSISPASVDTDLLVFDGCGGDLLAFNDDINFDDENRLSKVAFGGLVQGQEVLIQWASTWSSAAFQWTLDAFVPTAGDVCETPRQAVVGSNTSNKAPQWFTYTMPKAGGITISSGGSTRDTYLYVYDGCKVELLGENDDIDLQGGVYQSTVALTNLSTGQELFIYWGDEWSTSSFNWTLTLNVTNAAPLISAQTFILNEAPQNNDIIGTVVANDADNDALTFSIQSGNSTGIFSLNATTGELSVANAELLTTDKQLTIAVTDQVVTRTASITVDLTYVLNVGTDASLTIYPNPAKSEFMIDGGGIVNWSSGQLTDLSGKVVKFIEANQQRVTTHDLPDGMYLLQLETNAGVVVRRVVVH